MRIAYISSSFYADCDFPLIKALRECGNDVYYLTFLSKWHKKATIIDIDKFIHKNAILPLSNYKEYSEWGDFLDLKKSYAVNCTSARNWGIRSFLLCLREIILISSIKADAVIMVGVPDNFQILLLAVFRRIGICVIHDPLPHSGADTLKDSFERRLTARLARKFILLNKHQGKEFSERYKIHQKKIYYSHLGPYDCIKRYLPSVERTKEKFILFFGRFCSYKGIDVALDAFGRIHDDFPDTTLILAGSGSICFDWDKYSGEGYVRMINRHIGNQELSDLVSNAQFVVCPYLDATQSGVVLTAFALGTPVIGTSVGDIPDVVTHGSTGLIVPPNDAAALSEAFSELLSDKELLKKMRDSILLENHLKWGNIANDYLYIINQ